MATVFDADDFIGGMVRHLEAVGDQQAARAHFPAGFVIECRHGLRRQEAINDVEIA
jgi:hypothetical protein